TVQRIQEAIERCPRALTRRLSRELELPQSTVGRFYTLRCTNVRDPADLKQRIRNA
ncbi:hypothetical protein L9F63_017035, partial [Diploptera punctata]